MEKPEKFVNEDEEPEIIRQEENDERKPERPDVMPGLQEIHEIPGTDKGKKNPPLTPAEIQKIIDRINQEEEEDRKHENEVNEIIRKRDEEKKKKQ